MLSATQIEALTCDSGEAMTSDGNGLYIRARPNGTKTWIFKYTDPVAGRPAKQSFGTWPKVTLAMVRHLARDAMQLIGMDEWCPAYSHRILRMLELHAFLRLGKLPIGLIKVHQVKDTLLALADTGKREHAVRRLDLISGAR